MDTSTNSGHEPATSLWCATSASAATNAAKATTTGGSTVIKHKNPNQLLAGVLVRSDRFPHGCLSPICPKWTNRHAHNKKLNYFVKNCFAPSSPDTSICSWQHDTPCTRCNSRHACCYQVKRTQITVSPHKPQRTSSCPRQHRDFPL